MTYRDYTSIPYPTLRDIVLNIAEGYPLESVYLTKEGGICITFNCRLGKIEVKDILRSINLWDLYIDDYELSPLDYSYSNDMQRTYVYSADGIDYRALEVE